MIWPTAILGNLCSVITKGTTPRTLSKDYALEGIPFLRAENLLGDEVVLGLNTLFIDNETHRLLNRSVIKPEDVLISIAGTIGRCAIVPRNMPDMNCNQAVAIVRIVGPLDKRFFLHWLKTQDAQWQMAGAKVTQTISNLSLGQIKKLVVPLPSASEQHRIVEILDQADALRKKCAEADAKAARILPALFYKMFGDPATNPKGWRVVPIHKIIDPVERKDPSDRPYEPFIYIDIAGVDGVSGVITDVKRLTGAEAPSRARQIIKKNDVIISTVRPYLRATALVPMEYDNQICSTGFCVLRAKLGEGFGFLYALSRLQWFTDHLNARACGASYPAVTDRDILDFKVPIPDSREVLEQFDRQVLDIIVLEERQRKLGTKIGDLFDTLLHRAFTGDLTAKWR
jgi:type I restriction enzyme, S subunit